jgi:hypothetical protein
MQALWIEAQKAPNTETESSSPGRAGATDSDKVTNTCADAARSKTTARKQRQYVSGSEAEQEKPDHVTIEKHELKTIIASELNSSISSCLCGLADRTRRRAKATSFENNRNVQTASTRLACKTLYKSEHDALLGEVFHLILTHDESSSDDTSTC